jgi:hypothetical protein
MLTIVDLHREDELSPRSMAEAVGAWGDIKGGSTDDKHKDWSEVVGFSHPIAAVLTFGRPIAPVLVFGQPIEPLSVA